MSKCKIETPNQLPESGLTRVQFKTWKDSIIVYIKQNESFSPFLPGGKYSEWKRFEENEDRIEGLDATDQAALPDPDTQGEGAQKLAKLRKDLLTMLSIIGRKVDQYDYDDVMNESTSLASIWNMIELVYDIGRKGVHFLELAKIKYETGESPAKYYKRIYHHFMDNLYKKNDILAYKSTAGVPFQMPEDEKLSPTMLNFILYHTIENIDNRLLKKIKDKWGHLLTVDKCLHDYKDAILKAIPDLLTRLDQKEFEASALDTKLSAFVPRGRNRGRGRQFTPGGRGRGQRSSNSSQQLQYGRFFCLLCQTAGCPKRVVTSHNISNCDRWSRKDVEDLRVMMCEMQVDPNDWDDSSDSDQD